MLYFKFWTHLCYISNFEHTCAIFRTLNTLVQYFQFWTHLCKNVLWCHGSPRVELLYIVEADRSKWGPSKDRRVKNHDGNFHPFVYLSDAQNWWRLNSGLNDSRRSQSRYILTNRWNLTSTTFVHPDDAASVYSDPKLMVNNYWIDSWLYFHFHSYSPGMTEGVNINCCWWWWW